MKSSSSSSSSSSSQHVDGAWFGNCSLAWPRGAKETLWHIYIINRPWCRGIDFEWDVFLLRWLFWMTNHPIYTNKYRLTIKTVDNILVTWGRSVLRISDPCRALLRHIRFWYSAQIATTSSKHYDTKACDVTGSDSVHAIASRARLVTLAFALHGASLSARAVVFLCMVTVGKQLNIGVKGGSVG